MTTKEIKPLGGPAYGSIGHLVGSRRGPGDHGVPQGQHDICTLKTRDKHDRVIVTEKLDGSNVAVAKIGGEIIPLIRAGYPAKSSKREQHRLFHDWAMAREDDFRSLLGDGERACGEWIALAHGTRYRTLGRDPFIMFDIIGKSGRIKWDEIIARNVFAFATATLIHDTNHDLMQPPSIDYSMRICDDANQNMAADPLEGLVYRVERKGVFDFMAKYVRPGKVDGQYLPEISGKPEVWNWHPDAKKCWWEARP